MPNIKVIDFPPTNPEGEAKLKRFLETTAEFMHADIQVETAIVLIAKIPANRSDVYTVLSRIANAQKSPSNVDKK